MNLVRQKYWQVTEWKPSDPDWLDVQGIRYRLGQGQHTFLNLRANFVILTTTQEQELLIKLKFEPNLMLMLVTVGESYVYDF